MNNSKIRRILSTPRILAVLGLVLLILLGANSPLSAQTVTQGFGYDQPLQKGMIVQLKQEDATQVEPVTITTADQMFGVVVDANDAPVTLSPDGTKVFVAGDGRFDVLVSTQNGAIESGDYITASAVSGIGMKSDESAPVIIGRALEAFDGSANLISTTQISDSEGRTQDVALGRIMIEIGVSRNPLLKATEPNMPEFLRKASESIAGKPVTTARVWISVTLFVITSIVSAAVMYSGVRSAIIAIGRNPLSKKSIIRGMIQVVIVGITIFLLGVFGVYLILRM